MSVTKTIILTAMFFVCSFASAANYYVNDTSGNDSWNGLSAAWDGVNGPRKTIQAGMDAAVNGDTVIVAQGIYADDPNNRNLSPAGKSITIRSTDANDPNVVANTVIDPNGAGRGFSFDSDEDANCVIAGFTITNAHSGGSGGAIYCFRASPTIKNCIISNSSSSTNGGGLYLQISDSLITGCLITANTSTNDGGGIEWWYGNIDIRNCIFSGNQANGLGGGVDLFNSSGTIVNCTFAGNLAGTGGGLYCWNDASSNIAVSSCIFRENGAGVSDSQIGRNAGGIVSVGYSDIQDAWPGIGNIDIDPNFVSFDIAANPDTWNLRLQSRYGRWDVNSENWVIDINTSPCIDAGDPNSDWVNEPWPNGKRINMGAYGATPQASKNGNIADFDVSGAVDLVDLEELTSKWLNEETGIVNLDLTGRVDFADFAIFAQNWLWQK